MHHGPHNPKKAKKQLKQQLFKGGEADLDQLCHTVIAGQGAKNFKELVEKEMGQIVQQQLYKNKYTEEFEVIVNKLLKGTPAIFAGSVGNYTVQIEGQTYQLSKILKKMDSRFINISSTENCAAYMNFLSNKDCQHKPRKPSSAGGGIPDNTWYQHKRKDSLKDLDNAEMAAINIYTQNYYHQMNKMLRQIDHADFKPSNPSFNKNMKEVLLHIAMASSGLNKMPDKLINHTYRYEDEGLPKEVVQERINSVNSDKVDPIVTFERGFVSSAATKPAENFEGKARFCTVFANVLGKDISSISSIPSEREFLMNPSQFKWFHHEQYGEGNDLLDVFCAAPVQSYYGLSDSQKGIKVFTKKAKIDSIFSQWLHDINGKISSLSIGYQQEYNNLLSKIQNETESPSTWAALDLRGSQIERLKELKNAIDEASGSTKSTQEKFSDLSNHMLDIKARIHKAYGTSCGGRLINLIDESLNDYKVKSSKLNDDVVASTPITDNKIEFLLRPEIQETIQYVYDNFLSKEYDPKLQKYDGSDWEVSTPNGKVVRPNHGLAHTLRVAAFVPVIAKFLKEHNPTFANLTEADIQKAQYMMLFSVIGRGNEISYHDASALYENQNEAYKQQLIQYNQDKAQGKNPKEPQKPVHLYQYFKEIAKEGFSRWVDSNKPDIFSKEELASWKEKLDTGKPGVSSPTGLLMAWAHDLDLMRCYGTYKFDTDKMQHLIKALGGNKQAANDLASYARDLIDATGDRCMGYGKSLSRNPTVFGKCSKDYQECLKQIFAVPAPKTSSELAAPKPVEVAPKPAAAAPKPAEVAPKPAAAAAPKPVEVAPGQSPEEAEAIHLLDNFIEANEEYKNKIKEEIYKLLDDDKKAESMKLYENMELLRQAERIVFQAYVRISNHTKDPKQAFQEMINRFNVEIYGSKLAKGKNFLNLMNEYKAAFEGFIAKHSIGTPAPAVKAPISITPQAVMMKPAAPKKMPGPAIIHSPVKPLVSKPNGQANNLLPKKPMLAPAKPAVSKPNGHANKVLPKNKPMPAKQPAILKQYELGKKPSPAKGHQMMPKPLPPMLPKGGWAN